MVHRISDFLGKQATADTDKFYKHPDKQTDKQQISNGKHFKPSDLTIIQDCQIADSGVNMTDADVNTVTPTSTYDISYSFESCESPYGTYSYNSTPFSTESLVNVRE